MIKNKHKTPPKGKPSSRAQYADPANYKFPIDEKHIRAAISRYNAGDDSGYSSSQWASMGRRIASAARHLIGGAYRLIDGKVKRTGVATAEWDATALLTAEAMAMDAALGEIGIEITEALLDYFTTDEAAEDWDSIDEIAIAEEAEDMLNRDFPFGLIAVNPIVTEEMAVNGVPCFRYTSMVIPGDAVSKNTVPGKRGPTFYAGARIQQYLADNTTLLNAMEARGERVTVYPRHAAAMLDASLPIGWVERYFTQPSATRPGLEDLHYAALIPLTTEGNDLRMKMRSNLVRFSSLRTQPSPAFETKAVTMNGRTVEEAIRLPIAGIDLVATQPGLPVSALQILEESPTLGDAPPSDEPHEAEPRERRIFVIPGAARSTAGHEENTMLTCPFCKAALKADEQEAHLGAHAAEYTTASEELKAAKKKLGKAESRVTTLVEELADAKTANVTPPAPTAATTAATEELTEKLTAQATTIAEQKAEIATLKASFGANEELMKDMKTFQRERAIDAKLRELYGKLREKNPGFADFVLPLVEEAAAKLESADGVTLLWYETVSDQADAYMRQSMRLPSGRGFVHVPSAGRAGGAGTEERQGATAGAGAGTGAGAGAGEGQGRQRRATEEDEQPRSKYANLSPEAAGVVANWQ